MKILVAVLCTIFIVSCATTQPLQVDNDYILALSTANKFLEAWRSRDQEAGLALLSQRLLKSRTEDDWRMALSGVSNPHHESYEIAGGRRLEDDRFRFDVWLYDYYTGQADTTFSRRKKAHIILIRVGTGKWNVDDVPQL